MWGRLIAVHGAQPPAASDVFAPLAKTQLHTLRRRWSYILQARNDAREGICLLAQPAAVAKHLSSVT